MKGDVTMTNKEYKRLTTYNVDFDHPAMTATRGEDTTETIARHVDRLCYLEDCIEKGTLVFLPCKVDDKFWWIFNKYSGEHEIVEEKVKQIRICNYGFYIIDYDGSGWYLNEIYFTKEASEKALEELEGVKR